MLFFIGGFWPFLKAFWLIFEIYTGLILIEFFNAIMNDVEYLTAFILA